MININQLNFSYGAKSILHDLSLSIEGNHYFALAGLNGSGKTTLIKLMLDLLRTPDANNVQINGASSWDIASRKNIIYLPEKFILSAASSAWDYFKLLAGVYRQPLDVERVNELCSRLDFPVELLNKKSFHYSKGMLQKVGLIGCLMLDVPILLLDEPMSGLDPKARHQIKTLLLEEKQRSGRTLLYSTHMLADVEELCDSFGVLHNGELRFVGTPQQCMSVYAASTLELAYLNCINETA